MNLRMPQQNFLVLGAGVVGLTTAIELADRYPDAEITIAAQYFPGDKTPTYTSPIAGANWLSVALDNGRQENWDKITFEKFLALAKDSHCTGVKRMEIRAIYDRPPEQAGVLSETTNAIWYERLVGGLRIIPQSLLPAGAKFGYDADTFVVNTQVYLPW
jgi:D-amino-acid oxidase